MSDKPDLLAMLDAGEFLASPSSANAWLVRNRDVLIARFKGQRVDWQARDPATGLDTDQRPGGQGPCHNAPAR